MGCCCSLPEGAVRHLIPVENGEPVKYYGNDPEKVVLVPNKWNLSRPGQTPTVAVAKGSKATEGVESSRLTVDSRASSSNTVDSVRAYGSRNGRQAQTPGVALLRGRENDDSNVDSETSSPSVVVVS